MDDIEQIKELAMQADNAEEMKVEELGPKGEYSRDSLNRLVNSINELLKVFGANPIPQIDEDIDGELPAMIVKPLMMIDAALTDAQRDEYKFEIGELTNDRDLMMARGKIDAAAKDRAFKAFLAKPMQTDTEVEVDVEVEQEPPRGEPMSEAPMVEDEDELLLSRIR